jgi:hypothetical protein
MVLMRTPYFLSMDMLCLHACQLFKYRSRRYALSASYTPYFLFRLYPLLSLRFIPPTSSSGYTPYFLFGFGNFTMRYVPYYPFGFYTPYFLFGFLQLPLIPHSHPTFPIYVYESMHVVVTRGMAGVVGRLPMLCVAD